MSFFNIIKTLHLLQYIKLAIVTSEVIYKSNLNVVVGCRHSVMLKFPHKVPKFS